MAFTYNYFRKLSYLLYETLPRKSYISEKIKLRLWFFPKYIKSKTQDLNIWKWFHTFLISCRKRRIKAIYLHCKPLKVYQPLLEGGRQPVQFLFLFLRFFVGFSFLTMNCIKIRELLYWMPCFSVEVRSIFSSWDLFFFLMHGAWLW